MLMLIGSGYMAIEYAKVLKAQNIRFIVVGRGESSAKRFTELTGVPVITGGLENFIHSKEISKVDSAIVAVGVEALYGVSMKLLKKGLKNILIEKPGVLFPSQIKLLLSTSKACKANVYIAFNRRFLSSVRFAKKIIKADGGLTSFTFDFTEWGHEILGLTKAPGVKEFWVLANSSHVIDLAFYLGGAPQKLSAECMGSLAWHPTGAIFVGSGITVKGTPFSYHADWDAPGRWGLEFCTRKHKLILCPMEKLQAMSRGSVRIEEVIVDQEDLALDSNFKPGLYRMVEAFIAGDPESLCTISELSEKMSHYCAIAKYQQD